MARTFLATALIALAAVMVWIRAAPSGPDWHVDPETEGRTGQGRWLVADGGNAPAMLIDAPPAEILDAIAAIARSEGAVPLVWRPEAGRATFIHRSRVWGFPDYVSVKAVREAGRTRLSAYSRLRFGASDFGVNRARLERWLGKLKVAVA